MGLFDGLQKLGKDVGKQLDWRKITILEGDLAPGIWDFNGGMMMPDLASGLIECVALYGEIEDIQLQSEQSVSDWQKKAGVAAGRLIGGSGKEVCARVRLTDGRKFLATMDQRIFEQMQAFKALS